MLASFVSLRSVATPLANICLLTLHMLADTAAQQAKSAQGQQSPSSRLRLESGSGPETDLIYAVDEVCSAPIVLKNPVVASVVDC